MSRTIEILFQLLELLLVLAQGYFLQYFFGSFLEPRGRLRHTGLYAAVSYTVMRKVLDFL